MSISATMDGLDALERKLTGLGPKVSRRVVSKAMRDGAKVIQRSIKANTPVRSGLLKKSVKVKAKSDGPGRFVAMVTSTVTKGTMLSMRKKRKSTSTVDWKVFYGAFLEFGHRLGSRRGRITGKRKVVIGTSKKGHAVTRIRNVLANDTRGTVPPKPYVRPGFERGRNEAESVIREQLARGIEAAAMEQ